MKKTVVTLCAMFLATLCSAYDGADAKATAVTKKLDSIIVPDVQFREAHVTDVVQFLTVAARENDAGKTGVNIVLMDRESKANITLSLHKVSLHKALKLVGEMAGLAVDVEDGAVVLRKPKEEAKPIASGTDEPDRKSSPLVVYPSFAKQMDSPSFIVEYKNGGTTAVHLPDALAEERLVLDGKEYKRQMLKYGGGSNLKPGDSWSHTDSIHEFLGTGIRLEDGWHRVVVRFGGQESEPVVFAWSN